MKLTKEQQDILVGLILGDGYLQKTGKQNARLRLEHSHKQKEYIWWKYQKLINLMQDRPKQFTRYNPIFKKRYTYHRCQSQASPLLGKFRRWFYADGQKVIPEQIRRLLRSPLTLAVWYMDDGYFYHRDQSAYIYLPKYSEKDLKLLLHTLESNFSLRPHVYVKRGGNRCFYFDVKEAQKLMAIIQKYIYPSLLYKTPSNPVTTESAMLSAST